MDLEKRPDVAYNGTAETKLSIDFAAFTYQQNGRFARGGFANPTSSVAKLTIAWSVDPPFWVRQSPNCAIQVRAQMAWDLDEHCPLAVVDGAVDHSVDVK